jgi:hypothetical protein
MWRTLVGFMDIIPALHPEKPSETISTIRDVERLVEQVDPDLVVVDTLFDQAVDALQ